MLIIKSNMNAVVTDIIGRINTLKGQSPILREVAFDVLAGMVGRIHEEGKASDGGPIGTYSADYMKIRTGLYGNSKRVTRGKNKGKVKDSGVYTHGPNKGKQRPRYNRSNDKKVIVSLTRQLENDWGVMGIPNGWGIGFSNPFNLEKLRHVEAIKRKSIGNLTADERAYAVARFQELLNKTL